MRQSHARLQGVQPPHIFLGGWWLLLLYLQAACATSAPQRSAIAHEAFTLTLSTRFAAIPLSDGDVHEAFTQLMLEAPLRLGSPEAGPPRSTLVLASWRPGEEETSIEKGYARWCAERGTPGDCFSLIGGARPTAFGETSRFALGLILALSPAVKAASGVLEDISSQAMTMLLTGLSVYLLMLLAPEPISKGLALSMTVFLWGYLGADFWELLSSTHRLWKEARNARTFHDLREASERYAQVLGPNTVRILLVLATWKAGAKGDAATRGDGLPHFSQVVRNAARASRIQLPIAITEAQAVTITEGRLILALPSSSAAILAMQSQGEEQDGEVHHIATVKNEKSTLRGGPWTQRFKELFDKAEMSMEDETNKVRIRGHRGPHPQEYHQRVFERLKAAVRTCRTATQCRNALTLELKRLAAVLQQEGSLLNRLVTQNQVGSEESL